MNTSRLSFVGALLFFSFGCVAAPSEATADSYAAQGERMGVVLFDVFWGRAWGCGKFEHAQIRSLGFDLASGAAKTADAQPDFLLEGPWRLTAPRRFDLLAYLLEPGEYQISSFEVGFARSVSEIGTNIAKREQLLDGGKSRAGSFTVAAGEIVYLGNFAPDCADALPLPWRYYTEQGPNFAKHLLQYKRKYPFLPTDRAIYRLLETSTLGSTPQSK